MAKTTLTITVEIEHDSENTKKQGLDIWCKGLKEGQNVRGRNGLDESYTLNVKQIKEVRSVETKNGNIFPNKIKDIEVDALCFCGEKATHIHYFEELNKKIYRCEKHFEEDINRKL